MISEEEVRRAALIYRTARARGDNPSIAVMDELGINRPAASRRIARARQLGALEPARPGRTYPTNQKAEAIAKEIGVPYDVFVRAVLKYANGDLRVASV